MFVRNLEEVGTNFLGRCLKKSKGTRVIDDSIEGRPHFDWFYIVGLMFLLRCCRAGCCFYLDHHSRRLNVGHFERSELLSLQINLIVTGTSKLILGITYYETPIKVAKYSTKLRALLQLQLFAVNQICNCKVICFPSIPESAADHYHWQGDLPNVWFTFNGIAS